MFSKMLTLIHYLFLFLLIPFASAATVEYTFNIAWMDYNVDGLITKPIIAINGQWPPPIVRGSVGDTVNVVVNNNLANQSLTLHWHGILQVGNNHNDGTPMVAQCPIIPGSSYTYTVELANPGTYWYHSHSEGQYMDGLRGPLIVEDPNNPYASEIDEELVLTLSDCYHDQASYLIPYYVEVDISPWNGSEPVPQTALMNDTRTLQTAVQPGKTYFLRIINLSGFAQFYLHIDQHNFTIIETDGIYTHAQPAGDLYIANGQRYGVLLRTHDTATQNFAMLGMMDPNGFDPTVTPPIFNNVTGALVYNSAEPIPTTSPTVYEFDIVDDITLTPYDNMPLLQNPTQQIVLGLSFFNLNGTIGGSQYRTGFNNITYLSQIVPSLYTALSAGNYAVNPEVYGINSNSYVLQPNAVVEIVINNYDTGPHSLHIHGHQVQVVARGNGTYSAPGTVSHSHKFLNPRAVTTSEDPTALGFSNSSDGMPAFPMRRDTWIIPPLSYAVIRYVASNPGVWFFHCHMEWHVTGGLLMTLVEDPLGIQAGQSGSIPQSMQSICQAQGIPLIGNAAGNSQDYLNLTGQVLVPGYASGPTYPCPENYDC